MKREKIGKVLVDSGLLMIIDPCYIIDAGWTKDVVPINGKFFHSQKYLNMVDKMSPIRGDNKQNLEIDGGLVSTTFIGDGTYPVYYNKDEKGDVKEIIISLDEYEP